jgi:hypothetical protein
MILALLPCSAAAEQAAGQTAGEQPTEAAAGDRVVLAIADTNTRSGNRYNGEMGMWRYLAERLGVEIRYDYISPQEYASRLASGDLPDIVATDKNLSTILEYGVPEATAEGGEMFGMERMTAALNRCAEGSPEQILGSVRSAVDDFVGGAEQFDDLTMMCLEYKGSVNAGRS